MIEVSCSCGKRYRVNDNLAGKRVRCKACQKPIDVPELDEIPLEPADDTPPWVRDPSLVGAHGTVASNPGLMRFEPLTYIKCLPFEVVLAGVMALVILLIMAAAAEPNMLLIGVPVALIAAGIYLFKDLRVLRAVFRGGTRNQAVVVSEVPYRIAVFADLTTGGDPKPSILIIGAPLRFAHGGPFKVGTRLAAVAHYAGRPDADHWTHFMPTAVNCGVSDPGVIDEVMRSFTKRDWADLDNGLARLPSRKPGMYYLWGDQVKVQRTHPAVKAALVLVGVAIAAAVTVNGIRNQRKLDSSKSKPTPKLVAPVHSTPVR